MPHDAEPGSRPRSHEVPRVGSRNREVPPGGTRNREVPPGSTAPETLGEVIDNQLDDLVAYCRAFVDREADAVRTAHSVMDSAHALLTDPELLRAWLFALARRRAIAAMPGSGERPSPPQPQELLDLVRRHGIRPRDLPIVLGIPAIEAGELLAAAEASDAGRAADGGYDDDRSGRNGWHDDTGSGDDQPHDGRAGPSRSPSGTGGRHAARRLGSSRGWLALAGGRARMAAVTAIVVAAIGVGAAYLSESAGGAPGQAGVGSTYRPNPPAQTTVSSPSPAPAASPQPSPAPSSPVTVALPPPPPTSAKPRPAPSRSSTPPPSSAPPPSPSASASASASATPSPT